MKIYAGINTFFIILDKPQKIDPAALEISTAKSGFGYTISKDKVDVDGNGCTDFAVGYPKRNTVVLLRSKEVIKQIETSNTISIDQPSSIDPPVGSTGMSTYILH